MRSWPNHTLNSSGGRQKSASTALEGVVHIANVKNVNFNKQEPTIAEFTLRKYAHNTRRFSWPK